jgi:hypothetical protein
MAKRATSDIRRWALIGAEQRLLQLAQEVAAIRAEFPELRGGRSAGRVTAGTRGRRRRRTMSAEARKRISDAQKARWARQKAGGGAKKK